MKMIPPSIPPAARNLIWIVTFILIPLAVPLIAFAAGMRERSALENLTLTSGVAAGLLALLAVWRLNREESLATFRVVVSGAVFMKFATIALFGISPAGVLFTADGVASELVYVLCFVLLLKSYRIVSSTDPFPDKEKLAQVRKVAVIGAVCSAALVAILVYFAETPSWRGLLVVCLFGSGPFLAEQCRLGMKVLLQRSTADSRPADAVGP
jgi:hypothetical protein